MVSKDDKRRFDDSKHQRRAKELGVKWQVIDHVEIFDRDNWTCAICGESIPEDEQWPAPLSVSLDHITPLLDGGTHRKDNVQATHLRCNQAKNNSSDNSTHIEGPSDDQFGRIRESLEESIKANPYVTDSDSVTVQTARELADQIDFARENFTGQDLTKALYLSPHLMSILKELLATPSARKAHGIKEEVSEEEQSTLGKLRMVHGSKDA